MQNKSIDHGKHFDFGRASTEYAKYRDIYPDAFYQKIIECGYCRKGQNILDLGTGTGVLPRNLYDTGAIFTGIDIAENQIRQADILAKAANQAIVFQCVSAEQSNFADGSFDVCLACQCFSYFNHETLAPRVHRFLKEEGSFVILYMAWLPLEDQVARESERLIMKYNPDWTGGNEQRRPIAVPENYHQYFTVERQEVFDLSVPFTRESWAGRMLSCRGIGASLSEEKIAAFNREHLALLQKIAPEKFEVPHYGAMTCLKKKPL